MKRDVLVVGAGLSGLYAARLLAAQGVDVGVLEARDRVGGRTVSEAIGGTRFDLGGQWIGPTQDRIYRLCRELGVSTFPTFQQGLKVLELGGHVSTYKGEIPSLPPLQLLELELSIRRLESLAKKPDPSWDKLTVAQWRDRHVHSRRVRALLDASLRVIFGADPDELSFLHFLSYVNTAGGLMRLVEIEGGAQQDRLVEGSQEISKRVAANLGERVICQAPVRMVRETSAGLQVETDRGNYECRRLILAVPPALAGRIQWEPPMPLDRDLLCQRLPMGGTIKCIAVYDSLFWREAGYSGEVVVDGNPLTVVFDNTTAEGVPSLLGFIVGRDARIWGQKTPEVRKAAVLSCFTRWFGEKAAKPVAYGEKDWAADPWTRGCPIGVAGPGTLSTVGAALRRGWGRVHLAGTESASQWNGFLEGALESAERAVAEVLAA